MALTGTETLQVLGQNPTGVPAAQTFQTTTAAIAALAAVGVFPQVVNTAISTVGAGTLTAAGIVGGLITRTGPVAAYTDTTDTAVAIVAALTAYVAAESFFVYIKNATNFVQTLAAGAGVTLTANQVIPPQSVGQFLVTINSPTAVTLLHVRTTTLTNNIPEVITTISTVGAGTLTAAGLVGGVISRTGSQTATPFTDTTATADLILAAQATPHIGLAWEVTYQNTTNAVATLAGGTGVTVSGITVVPAGKTVRYLLTYTATSTMTMVGFASGESAAVSAQNVILAGSTSGTTTIVASATAGTTTQTLPAVTGVSASTSGTNLYIVDVKRCTAQVDATTTTLANVTGLSQTVVVGTYRFEIDLYGTCGGTGGWKLAFNYTTAVLSAINANGFAYTASAVAVSSTTTTTTQISIIASNTAFINGRIVGTMTVSTGGTVDLQFAENSANSTSSIFVGSTMKFERIA